MPKRNRNRRSSQFPPPYFAAAPIQKALRYKSVGGTAKVYRNNLLSLICVATGAAAAYSIIQNIRVKRIRAWDASGTTAFGTTIQLKWYDTRGSGVIVADSGTNSRPAHIDSRPPPNSVASMWSQSASFESELLFFLTLNAGSIVEIDLEYILEDGICSSLVGTFSTGGVYYNDLDCLNSAGAGAGTNTLQSIDFLIGAVTARTAVAPSLATPDAIKTSVQSQLCEGETKPAQMLVRSPCTNKQCTNCSNI
jgi:hypothetical protein